MSKSYLQFIVLGFILGGILSSGGGLTAQGDEACPALVTEALATVDDSCADVGRNQVCYGHTLVMVERFEESASDDFIEPGRRIDIASIESIQTAALNVEEQVWGVAVLSLQANIPDALPGENVTFVIFGDTELINEVSPDSEADEDARYLAPMQAFRFTNGVGETACAEAPHDGLLVQTQGETVVYFRINGVDVSVGSTAFFTASNDELLSAMVIEGQVTLTHQGETQTALAGERIRVLDDDGTPEPPTPYAAEDVEPIPLESLPLDARVPVMVSGVEGSLGWVDSGVFVAAGQTFVVSAHGQVTIWPGCRAACPEDMAWETDNAYVPSCAALCDAVTTGPAGSVPIETVAIGASVGYIMPDQPIGALLGKVGDGEPFFIGSGGTFIADVDGTLQLHVHEDDRTAGDETGQFVVSISVRAASE